MNMRADKMELVSRELQSCQRTWLVTGVAGFIGSNLLETLLNLDQSVIGLDNYETGYRRNLEMVAAKVGGDRWKNFKFVEGDIRSFQDCISSVTGVDIVLHQAALGSVPRSVENPIATNATNVSGFLNMLIAARDAGVSRIVYAASSSTYGDHEALPKKENQIGRPLSPYAVTKLINELYAEVVTTTYGLSAVGLRYFNVFGPRQDPSGAYAAVVPRWIKAMIRGEKVYINGDGETSRDFCYVDNVVQANILAGLASLHTHEVFNIAVGNKTTLNSLFRMLKQSLATYGVHYLQEPVYCEFRDGDVRHSQADITKAQRLLGYKPNYTLRQGIEKSMSWFVDNMV